jgi:large repetitive protein
VLADAAPAAADRAFATRFSTNDTGNIAFAANTLMVCPASSTGCTTGRNTPPISSGSNGSIDNNGYLMQYVNAAPGAVSGSPSFDSSSSTLSLPATATVLFAGLYWGGDTSAGSSPNGAVAPNAGLRNQVGFQPPGAPGYASVTASAVDQASSSATRYTAFANVTGLVQAAGAGTYSVANVQSGTGGDRYAGWTLVVAYRDSTQPPRNLTIDDGFIAISSSAPPTTIPITGFRTPPSGAVRTTLGFVAYEGDSGLAGDSASLNGTKLSDAANPPNNFFNSGITNLGTNTTTRTPNDINNWAYDSKLVNANGILPNNATSANIVVTTNGDAYYPAVVTLATDLYAPNITSSKSVTNLTHPGGPDRRGDELRYTVSYRNTGADAATNFVMRDPIPSGSTYVPNSLRITAGPQAPASPTDALGDDAAELDPGSGQVVFRLGAGGNGTTGGTIAPAETDTVTFDVTINADDAPGQQIVNQATAAFIGQTLGIPFTDTSPQVTNTVAAPDLTIVKSHTGGLIAGRATTFTLAVSNVGNSATDGSPVTVTDPFPADSFSQVATAGGAGWSCAIAGLTLTCTRADTVPAGNSYPPILVDATVQDPAPGTIINTATVSGGGSADSSGSDGGGANGLADLSIAKTADPGTVASGGQVTYTLTVQNSGPSSAQNVTVSDPVSAASYSDVSAQPTQGTCDTSVSCSLGTLTPNATATITITATVVARDTTLTNIAAVSSSTPDPIAENNSDSASVTVPASADLAIAKTGPANPDQGGPDSFTITVSNSGPDTATEVVVNDTLPSQFSATGASGPGFSCTVPGGSGGTVVCTSPSLAPTGGAPPQITITGTLAGGIAGQTIRNVATVGSNSDDPDSSSNTASFGQLVGPVADVAITKQALTGSGSDTSGNPPDINPGGTFNFGLEVTNFGPSAASAVQVTDTLPANVTLTAAVPGCSPGAGSGGTITCTVATLASGSSTVITLPVMLSLSATPGSATNTATVANGSEADPDPSNNMATAQFGIGALPNFALSKRVTPQRASAGDVVTYTFSVINNGAAGSGGLVTDALPTGLQFVASTTGCTNSSGPPDTVSCDLGGLAPNASATASFTALVTSAAAGMAVQNQATVATQAEGGFPALPDLDPTDNTDSTSLTVNPLADLSLTKTVSTPDPGTDDEVEYTLTASNAGPNDATAVTIHDSLPTGLDFVDASPGCDDTAGTVTCDLGTIASASNASVTIRARTTTALAGTAVGNLATVTANELDPNPGNNQATAMIDVQSLVDLQLTKVVSNPSPAAGGPVSYTLLLVNRGPSPATDVTITDPLPSGLSFVSAAAGQGSCNHSGQTVSCRLGTLPVGGVAVVTITADVAGSAAGATLPNTATASASDPIARPELLSSNVSIRPIAAPPKPVDADLALVKRVNHATGRTGERLIYTITVTNHGPATASSPKVTDSFSAPVKIVSVHAPGGSCSKRRPIVCKLSSIASGANAKITIVAQPTVPGSLRNSAGVTSATPDPKGTNNLSHVSTKVRPGPAGLRLSKTASDRRVSPGQTFSFTIGVRSLGPEPALKIKVCDRLSSFLTFVSVDHASSRDGIPCWTISSLAKGRVKRFVVRVRAPSLDCVPVDCPGVLTNVATATAEGVRMRTARATVVVVGEPSPIRVPDVTFRAVRHRRASGRSPGH